MAALSRNFSDSFRFLTAASVVKSETCVASLRRVGLTAAADNFGAYKRNVAKALTDKGVKKKVLDGLASAAAIDFEPGAVIAIPIDDPILRSCTSHCSPDIAAFADPKVVAFLKAKGVTYVVGAIRDDSMEVQETPHISFAAVAFPMSKADAEIFQELFNEAGGSLYEPYFENGWTVLTSE